MPFMMTILVMFHECVVIYYSDDARDLTQDFVP